MNTFFDQKTVLISGGSRGIGRAIALRLASSGAATIIVNYLNNEVEADKTCKLIATHNCEAIPVKANLAYPDEIDRLFGEISRHVNSLDAFVHSAALTTMKPTCDLRPNQWDLTMNVNTRAFLLCVQHCLPLMKEGAIVALSSLGAIRAVPNYGAMGPAKAALEAVVRHLAVELAAKRIRVNAVSGGPVRSESLKLFPDAESIMADVAQRTPAGRLGEPEDIADVAMFLLTSEARWICGQTLIADGGLSLV